MPMIKFGPLPAVLVAFFFAVLLNLIVPKADALELSEGVTIAVVSFLAACVANATAVGGGFIFMPFFIGFYSLPAITTLKLSLCTQAFGMSSGMLSWSLGLIQRRILVWAATGGGIGAVLGTFVFAPGAWIKPVFGLASILIGLISLLLVLSQSRASKPHPIRPREISHFSKDAVFFFLLCVMSGAVTAWVSIGIGEIVALWMILRGRYEPAVSIATGVATLALCSVFTALLHLNLGGIPVAFLAYTVPGVILGGFSGANLAKLLVFSQFDSRVSPQLGLKLIISIVIFLDGLVTLFIWRSDFDLSP